MAKENGKSALITAFFSLIGVLAGATIQYFVTTATQKSQLWSQLRTGAYAQYIENTAKLDVMQRQESPDLVKIGEARALRNSARYLIGLYGTGRVVQAMSDYIPTEKNPKSEEFRTAAVALFAAMRQDLLSDGEKIGIQPLRMVLFPEQPNQ